MCRRFKSGSRHRSKSAISLMTGPALAVLDVAGPAVIMTSKDLTDAEIRRGRALRATERFVTPGTLSAMGQAALRLDFALRVGADVAERKDLSVSAGTKMREAVWEKLGSAGVPHEIVSSRCFSSVSCRRRHGHVTVFAGPRL